MTHRYRPRFQVAVARSDSAAASTTGERPNSVPLDEPATADASGKKPRQAQHGSVATAERDAQWNSAPLLDALFELHHPARR